MSYLIHERIKLFSITEIKDRGWTPTAIKRFLPDDPDDEAPNPYYRNAGSPMKFYFKYRVLRAEKSKAFRDWRAKLDNRRKQAKKSVKTRVTNMVKKMEQADITIDKGYSFSRIYDLALRTHGGNYMGNPGEFRWSMEKGHNTIRHRLTNYEELWELCNRGYTGSKAYSILRDRVDRLIDGTYPEFANEELWTEAESRRVAHETAAA